MRSRTWKPVGGVRALSRRERPPPSKPKEGLTMLMSDGSIMLLERERRLLERLARQYSMTFVEVCMQLRRELLLQFDPAPGEGERFVFTSPNLLGPNYFAGRNVPAPDANVDLLQARGVAQSD